jgi:hypothetical protein
VQEILDLYDPTGRPSDYQAWDANFPGIDLPATADADKDGLSNETERLFGLDPTSARSPSPVTTTANNVQTVTVTVSPALLSSGRRFVRVQAVVP